VEKLSPLECRLLAALWGQGGPAPAAPLVDVVRAVYGPRTRPEEKMEAFRKARARAQEKLDGADLGIEIDLTNGYLRLCPLP
jgi:hypothetical protein